MPSCTYASSSGKTWGLPPFVRDMVHLTGSQTMTPWLETSQRACSAFPRPQARRREVSSSLAEGLRADGVLHAGRAGPSTFESLPTLHAAWKGSTSGLCISSAEGWRAEAKVSDPACCGAAGSLHQPLGSPGEPLACSQCRWVLICGTSTRGIAESCPQHVWELVEADQNS